MNWFMIRTILFGILHIAQNVVKAKMQVGGEEGGTGNEM